jgi:DNA-directed RNA polymerase specialized sigma24 family protein
LKCGELADGDSFPVISGVGARRKACHNCTNRQKKQDRIQRGIGVPAPRPPMALQVNTKRPWSSEDDSFLRDNVEGMTYEAIAVALGRSLGAVYQRRDRLGLARVRKSHRVAKPWRIQ